MIGMVKCLYRLRLHPQWADVAHKTTMVLTSVVTKKVNGSRWII